MKRKADQTEDQPRKKTKINDEAKANLFLLLPDEILHEILSYLNEDNLRWTRLIECRLCKLIDIRHFNIGVILDASEMSEVTRVFGRYDDKPIGLTFRKADNIYRNFKVLSQLTQLTSLDIGTKTIDVVKLTNLQSLTATVEPFNLQLHSRLTYFKTDELQIVKPHMYPAHLEQLNINSLLKPDRANEAKFKTNSERYIKCFEAMPNITKLQLTEPYSPIFMPGIRCQLTGLASLATGVGVTGLPVDTMTELFVSAKQSYGPVNWSFSHLTNLRRIHIDGSTRFMNHVSLLPFTLLESLIIRGAFANAYLTQLNGSNITQLEVSILGSQDSLKHIITFTKLQSLSLDINQVDIGRLSHLMQLTRFHTTSDKALNIADCTKLTNLLSLTIRSREDTGEALIVLSSLTRLTSLDVKYCPSVDVSNMTTLQDLEVFTEHEKTIIGLSTLHNLTRLTCCSDHLTDELCDNITALQYLHVIDVVSDQTLESVAKLTRLTYLNGRTSGSGASLTRLTRLQDLYIRANEGSKKIAKDLHEKLIFCPKSHPYSYLERNDDTYDDSDDDYE